MKTNRIAALLGAAWFAGTGVIVHAEDKQDVQELLTQLKAKVDAQQTEINQLRNAKGDAWLDERRADEVKALVREVLSDADTRASLLDAGLIAGHNGSNFFLASEDNSFLLKITGQLQVRYTANFRDTGSTATDGDEDGFSIRRAKIGFEGFIGSPKLEYKVLLDIDRNTSLVGTQDLWISYNVLDNLKVWGGRFPDRFAREAIISSRNQQAADRSALAYIWAGNDDNVEGVGAEWKALPDWLILAATVNDGLNSGTDPAGAGVGFQNTPHDFQNDASNIAFSGRVDLKLAGDWKNASDVEAWSNINDDLQFFLGAGGHYEVSETGDRQAISRFTVTPPGGTATGIVYDDFTQFTVDALLKYEGFSVFAAGYAWFIDTPATSAVGEGTVESYAASIQGGYFVIPDKLEPFVRYEWISVDDALNTNDLNIVTGGANYFFKKHAAKFTLDAVWALNNVNSANTFGTSLSGVGLLTDDLHQENQVVVRAQFQLLF